MPSRWLTNRIPQCCMYVKWVLLSPMAVNDGGLQCGCPHCHNMLIEPPQSLHIYCAAMTEFQLDCVQLTAMPPKSRESLELCNAFPGTSVLASPVRPGLLMSALQRGVDTGNTHRAPRTAIPGPGQQRWQHGCGAGLQPGLSPSHSALRSWNRRVLLHLGVLLLMGGESLAPASPSGSAIVSTPAEDVPRPHPALPLPALRWPGALPGAVARPTSGAEAGARLTPPPWRPRCGMP